MRYIILLITLSIIVTLSWVLSGILRNQSSSYTIIVTGLLWGIFVILGGCKLFANGVECVGDRLNLSHATVGSLFAAVGTALPETVVPVIALLTGSAMQGEHIAVGAILGAPFMLGTLAMFLLGLTVILLYLFKKRQRPVLNINLDALRFVLLHFIPIMILVLLSSLIDNNFLKHSTAIVLILIYVIFFYNSLKHKALEGETYTDSLYLSNIIGSPVNLGWSILQIMVGLSFIASGAHLFVKYLTAFSIKTGAHPLVLSLLITPVATELPEKFNSITWTIKGRDTIGLGNITGAMVFQSTIPMSIGLFFTQWHLSYSELYNIVSTIMMAGIIVIYISLKKRLHASLLLTGGVFYLIYVVQVFFLQ